MVALLALFSDVIIPKVCELTTAQPVPPAEEAVEENEGDEESEAAFENEGEGDENEVERLREENRFLKELVGEKELALRKSSED